MKLKKESKNTLLFDAQIFLSAKANAFAIGGQGESFPLQGVGQSPAIFSLPAEMCSGRILLLRGEFPFCRRGILLL